MSFSYAIFSVVVTAAALVLLRHPRRPIPAEPNDCPSCRGDQPATYFIRMNKPKRNSILLPLSVASLLGFITKPAPFHRPGARRGVVRNHRCMCGCGGKIKACRRASRYSKYVPENLVGPRVRQGVSAKMRKLARFIAKPDGTIHLPSVMRQRLAAA